MNPLISSLSEEVHVMLRPEKTYRRLADEVRMTKVGNREFRYLVKRPLFAAFMIGAFASFTTSGRLNALLLMDGMLFWGFVPLLQTLTIICLILIFARHCLPSVRALDLFFMGHGPWYLWLLLISGTCLFVPTKQIFLWPVQSGWVLPVSLLIVWTWSNSTTLGFLKGALSLSTGRALFLLVAYNVVFWGIMVSYLFAIETLQLHRLRF